jgi:hypothetical protein
MRKDRTQFPIYRQSRRSFMLDQIRPHSLTAAITEMAEKKALGASVVASRDTSPILEFGE